MIRYSSPILTEALFYKKLNDKKVVCRLCPHNCIIDQGKRGYCGVRKNIKGKLIALTAGHIISAACDPVEKKPLYHFYPGSQAFSLGGFGCNLACKHCQNHEISQTRNESSFSFLYDMSPEKIIKSAKENHCKLIAWTYNEPTIWYEYIIATSKLALKEKIKTVLITNGVINIDPLEALLPYIDAYRVDVKGFTNSFYEELTGFPYLKNVLDSAKLAYDQGCHVEIVSNIIPNWNDGKRHIEGIAKWIKEELDESVPWHITAYHPANNLHEQSTPVQTLENAYGTGKKLGLKHIYLGNVYTATAGDTHCPKCNKTLISRDGMSTRSNIIKKGKCPLCGYKLQMYQGN